MNDNSLFAVHKLNAVGIGKARYLARYFDDLLMNVSALTDGGDGRCIALLKTHLELASFYAKKRLL